MRILFLCYGNRIRSQMAEAWAEHLGGDSHEVASAGIVGGGPIFPETAIVMQEVGIDVSCKISKSVDRVDVASFDLAVSLCHVPASSIVGREFSGRTLNLPVPDPAGQDLDMYRRVRDQIRELVAELLSDLEQFREE